MLYRLFFSLVLARLDAEKAHAVAGAALRAAIRVPGVAAALRRLLVPRDPALEVRALGLTFATPLGVAAGLDKGGTWFEGLGLLGFGHVEVGTVTPHAQPGNDRPRIRRLLGERALVNWMGFPNPGAEAVAGRLGRRPADLVVGANVSKGLATPLEDAPADCRKAARLLGGPCDYVVVNVSSPNTPGLRDLQAVDRLRPLVLAVRDELARLSPPPPLLLKISPDLADEDVDAVADLALELGVDGIVAVNTTTAGLARGGLSGPPLRARSLEVLRRLRRRVGTNVVLVSVGGVESSDDVWERIAAGATLVQAYTGFVYGGPLWPRRINRALVQIARRRGYERVQDAVGSDEISTLSESSVSPLS